MSKKPVSQKVHQLAKELGLSSKDIITRCQSEDIPDITTHLSPVSVGLALTIREWFAGSLGGVATATAPDTASASESVAAPSSSAKIGAFKSPTSGTDSTRRASTAGGEGAEGAEGAEGTEAPRAVAKRATKKPTPADAPT